MAVACGEGFTAVVREQGDLWTFGNGEHGRLGLGTVADQLLPALVGGADEVFDGEGVVMVAAGLRHTACVTAKGTLWTWGGGEYGRLGHGDRERRQRPVRLGKEMYGGSPAVMVACGGAHTLVLTVAGLVWSCGWGLFSQLGHGDTADKLVLTLVAVEGFRGTQIVMVAAGGRHSVALEAEGRVWTWGWGQYGQLGQNDGENRVIPTLLACETLGGAAVVLVAAGYAHTVAVTIEGALWVWGWGLYGQLGLGDEANRLAPTLVGAEASFGGSLVLTVTCGKFYTLAVTKDGALFTFGFGADGARGHKNKLVPTRIEAQHFGNAKIVCAAAGSRYSAAVSVEGTLCDGQSLSAAVTAQGALYTWGAGRRLGHADGQAKLVPTLVASHLLQGARVGRCHGLSPLHALAFTMGTHARLGSADETAPGAEARGCPFFEMPGELVRQVVEACGSWPEGRAGELEGVVQLMGGGRLLCNLNTTQPENQLLKLTTTQSEGRATELEGVVQLKGGGWLLRNLTTPQPETQLLTLTTSQRANQLLDSKSEVLTDAFTESGGGMKRREIAHDSSHHRLISSPPSSHPSGGGMKFRMLLMIFVCIAVGLFQSWAMGGQEHQHEQHEM